MRFSQLQQRSELDSAVWEIYNEPIDLHLITGIMGQGRPLPLLIAEYSSERCCVCEKLTFGWLAKYG